MSEGNVVINMFRDSPWPGNILSNFAQTPFVIDDIHCACSEAFIQSLKLPDANEQKVFCGLQGQDAWEKGSKLTASIFVSGKIWWRGVSYPLHSKMHFDLVKKGLLAKFSQSKVARDALLATANTRLIHDYGQSPSKQQSLPVDVFCQMVTEIRDELRAS
ncbi:hypothetical protein OFY17_04980 [Marinomonas sp. C2222]|uniref:Riboflavin biosynthesis intermediates N-glycosidase n=1 Tax=Marinomonas sargassi TaxID=2984494 RepID=A0ABT2YQR9_9GAMM|nr:hypothetical protein [Marinomonas sargassi]MCV2402238.1 hypothetical protein [Marinomonas sargassi]